MDVPVPAIQWLARHASSNTELAILTNVCRKWRETVIETILDQAEKSVTGDHASGNDSLLLLPSMARFLLTKEKSTNNQVETYCVSWFHPRGIEYVTLALDEMDESDEEDEDLSYMREEEPAPFVPSGQESYMGSEEEGKSASRRQQSRSPDPLSLTPRRQMSAPPDKYVNCLSQWNGYKDAVDVLRPFGFADCVIRDVTGRAISSSMKMEVETNSTMEESTNETIGQKNNSNSLAQKFNTYAVRGSTIARPEGYCLCWDNQLARIQDNLTEAVNDSKAALRQHEFNNLMKRRKRRRRELQREVLPRVRYSTSNSYEEAMQLGIKQPCVQFLNVDASHAVRLFTPQFKPGPVPTPITIFFVAIATEDGCFLSGLKKRFEMGHLYPKSAVDNLIERSPICICTEVPTSAQYADSSTNTSGEEGQDDDKDSSSFNSDDSSCDMSMEAGGDYGGLKCACPFSGAGTAASEEESKNQATSICRGHRGPGMWHCYTAVIDGASTSIRVDGTEEEVRSSKRRSTGPMTAFLDGLTIGADHTFDMSLCFGQGSGNGEGEGAMAELAVFKGRLGKCDIESMERQLMAKHGIPQPDVSLDLNKEDNFNRLAHAMLSYAPHHKVFANGSTRVPLRYLAKHRLVSWRQVNPVTGEKIQVQRIGTKFGGSSSDW